MGIRIIVAIDTDQDDPIEAYRAVRNAMAAAEAHGPDPIQWESTEEWYDVEGESLDVTTIEHARMTVVREESR